ncbi:hypothetical protein Tcan_11406, partial [Toxocara canis]
ECPTKFFAEEITYEKASSLSFYFTRKRSERYESFMSANKQIVMVACAEKCKSKSSSSELNGSDKLPTDNVVASIRTDTLWSKIRTQNANVPANDEAVSKTKSESRLGVEGVNISESSLASALRHPQYVYRVVLNRFRGGKLVNGGGVDDNTPTESYRAFPEMPPKKTSSSKLQTKKSTGEAQKPPAAQGKGAASPTTAAQKPDVKHKQYRNVDQPDGELPYKSGERPFPLREWKKISEPKETSSVDGEGFLNKLIIEGIHGSYAENVQDSSGERALSERESVPKGSSSEFAACFNVVVGQFLLHAGYEMYANVTREECRCLCAESWTAKWSTRRCKSFQYNALGECLLNKDNHFGKFDLVYDLSAEYHFINCSQPWFSARSMNNCPKQIHKIVGEHSASEQFSHSFKVSLPALPTFKADERKRTIVNDMLKSNEETRTTTEPPSTSQMPEEIFLAPSVAMPSHTTTSSRLINETEVSNDAPITTPIDVQPTTLEAMPNKSKVTSFDATPAAPTSLSTFMEVALTTSETLSMAEEIATTEMTTVLTTINSTKSLPDSAEVSAGSIKNDVPMKSTSYTLSDEISLTPTKAQSEGNVESTENGEKLHSTTTVLTTSIEPIAKESMTPSTPFTTDQPLSEKNISEAGFKIPTLEINERITTPTKSPAQISTANNPSEISTSTSVGTTMTAMKSVSATASTLPENEGDYEEDDELTTGNYLITSSENGIISSTDRSEIPQVKVSSPSPESCFEVIDGYVMKSTAGALENDVSLEECQCFCVTSRALARYSFQCASATYYHNERDCVLNLDNRRQRPDLFHENFQKQFNVSYIGMLCSSEYTDNCFLELPNFVLEGTALAVEDNTTIEECKCYCIRAQIRYGTECQSLQYYFDSKTCLINKENRKKGLLIAEYTDNCFLELPNFVLEGTALAVEDNTTIEECKCYCIRAQIRYGTECQSLQYYFDSKTCLINKENRISNLDRFNFAPAATMSHSYFDFRCATDRTILSVYVDEICSTVVDLKPKMKITKNDISFESRDQGNNGPENNEVFEDEMRLTPLKPRPNVTSALIGTTSSTEMTPVTQSHIPTTEKISAELSNHISITATTTYSPWKFEEPDDGSYYEAEETYDETDSIESITTTKKVSSSLTPVTNTSSISTISTQQTSTTKRASNITTTTQQATTTSTYTPAGPCTYSAIYQTSFKGNKLLKRILVSSPAQCFSGCYHEGCRSANLIQFSGVLKYCELYRDALIDYRTPNVLGFDSTSVYFDGIRCEGVKS